jgi:hypothetical protein
MLVFLFIVFLVIIALSFVFYNVEYFNSDSLSDAITNLQKKFTELESAAKKAEKTQVSTPDGFTPVSNLVANELNYLASLKNIYSSGNLKDSSSIIKSLDSSYTKYNYINTYLKLNLPPLVNNLNSKDYKTSNKKSSKKKGINLKKKSKLSGKSLSRKQKMKKTHSSIINHAMKNSIIKDLIKRFGLKDSRRSKSSRRSKVKDSKTCSSEVRGGSVTKDCLARYGKRCGRSSVKSCLTCNCRSPYCRGISCKVGSDCVSGG